MNASKIKTNAFGSNLVKDFYEMVNWELYDIAREKNTCDFEIDSSSLSSEILDFMKLNEVPSCKVGMVQNGCHYEIMINGKQWYEFDWNVSEKVEKLHADDYEISKDEMYSYYDDDYGTTYEDDESSDYLKYMVTDEDY